MSEMLKLNESKSKKLEIGDVIFWESQIGKKIELEILNVNKDFAFAKMENGSEWRFQRIIKNNNVVICPNGGRDKSVWYLKSN